MTPSAWETDDMRSPSLILRRASRSRGWVAQRPSVAPIKNCQYNFKWSITLVLIPTTPLSTEQCIFYISSQGNHMSLLESFLFLSISGSVECSKFILYFTANIQGLSDSCLLLGPPFFSIQGYHVQLYYYRRYLFFLKLDMTCLIAIHGRPAIFCREKENE